MTKQRLKIKTDLTKDSIKIYGQPNLEIKKSITVKNYLKDHPEISKEIENRIKICKIY